MIESWTGPTKDASAYTIAVANLDKVIRSGKSLFRGQKAWFRGAWVEGKDETYVRPKPIHPLGVDNLIGWLGAKCEDINTKQLLEGLSRTTSNSQQFRAKYHEMTKMEISPTATLPSINENAEWTTPALPRSLFDAAPSPMAGRSSSSGGDTPAPVGSAAGAASAGSPSGAAGGGGSVPAAPASLVGPVSPPETRTAV